MVLDFLFPRSVYISCMETWEHIAEKVIENWYHWNTTTKTA